MGVPPPVRTLSKKLAPVLLLLLPADSVYTELRLRVLEADVDGYDASTASEPGATPLSTHRLSFQRKSVSTAHA